MKVYLAGCDSTYFNDVLESLDYPYRLTSYLSLVSGSEGAGAFVSQMINQRADRIMDSGLFSFMFGAGQGMLKSYDDYLAYATKYVEAMRRWRWRHRIVECDTQKILGMKDTQQLRDTLFRPSEFEVIYVWHLPEGEDGLRKLAREEKYIALSVPELRQSYTHNVAGLYKELFRLIHIARNAGPAKIHLLGNTEIKLMALPADSCDSTSWLSSCRFGKGVVYRSGGRLDVCSIYSPKWWAWHQYCASVKPEGYMGLIAAPLCTRSSKALAYYTNARCSAYSFQMMMEENDLNG